MITRPILRVMTKLLIPAILIFGLYVQFHGDYGPGGGFQAGVIFASAIIVHALLFGVHRARWILPPGLVRFILAFGVLLYAGVGVAGIFLGGAYLDYNVLAHEPTHGQHIGILLIEFGVGATVAAAMITIFLTFAGHDQPLGGE
jgi:multicomponent Na+:H+ antiporter subunit B